MMRRIAAIGVCLAAFGAVSAEVVKVDRVLAPIMPTEAELPGYKTWNLVSHVYPKSDWGYTPVREELRAEFRREMNGPVVTFRSFVFESYQQAVLWETQLFSPEPVRVDTTPGESVPGFSIGDRCTFFYKKPEEGRRFPDPIGLAVVKGKVLTYVRWSEPQSQSDLETLKQALESLTSRVQAAGLGTKARGPIEMRLNQELATRAVELLSHPRFRVEQP